MKVLADFKANNAGNSVATISYYLASRELQQFLFLHLGKSNCCAMTLSYNQSVDHLDGYKWYWRYPYHFLTSNIDGASIIFGFASLIVNGQFNCVNP